MSEVNEFTWDDKDFVVIERVDALAVYKNPNGDTVIRQQKSCGEDDAVIIIPKSRINDLITSLQNEGS